MMIEHNDKEMCFIAFSLTEAQELFLGERYSKTSNVLISKTRQNLSSSFFTGSYRICIDIANGHMKELLDTIEEIKKLHSDKVIIMSGNIANPKTYDEYERVGCDYVRCSIGSGSRCTTSSNVSVHYGCFSLLQEIWNRKQNLNGKCKIIADGGIKGYGDIQKALLYADYVMIGGIFNKAIDSAGTPKYGRSSWSIFGKRVLNPFKTLLIYGKTVRKNDYEKVLKLIKMGKIDVWKEYYGMSTKIAQSKIDPNAKLKTSEGKVQRQMVEYSIKQWAENETDYLRSAMSYTDSRTLSEYQDSEWVQLTYKSYNN
jgi:GMP reductase